MKLIDNQSASSSECPLAHVSTHIACDRSRCIRFVNFSFGVNRPIEISQQTKAQRKGSPRFKKLPMTALTDTPM